MFNEQFDNKTFENHSLYSNFLSIGGMRISEGATKPSIYITELKLKNALKTLTDIEIEEIFDKEMTAYNCGLHREKLKDKISNLMEWQLLKALEILLEDGRYESILYIRKCKKSDKQ